jgi:hypothetical protein
VNIHDVPMPSGPIDDPSGWTAEDLAVEDDWTWQLTAAEVDELLDVAARLEGTDSVQRRLPAGDVSLPLLAPRLDQLRHELISGRGFTVIRGFPVDALTQAQAEAAFVVLGSQLGSARSQNRAGDLLGHVRNVGANANDPNVRIYQTAERQTFHTDSADVVGLLCLEPGASGGDSLLVSAVAIHNAMNASSPELCSALFAPLATDRRGEVPAGADPWFTIPVFSWYDDRLTVMYQRQYIESAQRFGGAPKLRELQRQALDLFDDIANDPAMHISMSLERGDMQFVHNHSLLHDRTAFVDKPRAPRHLLRLWLSVQGDRQLPSVFTQRFGSVVVGDRGGIIAA